MKNTNNNNIENQDWIIHAVKNGLKCAVCGQPINNMVCYAANFHTHGMENYNHLDFQVVLNIDEQLACYILDTFANRVRAGERFQDGDYVKGIFEDCDVRLDNFEEAGRQVLRVIIPDANNLFPGEEGCEVIPCIQLFETDELYTHGDGTSCRCGNNS